MLCTKKLNLLSKTLINTVNEPNLNLTGKDVSSLRAFL